MNDCIKLKQLVEIFVHSILHELRGKYEGFKLNFVFQDDAIKFFHNVKMYPFTKEGYFIPNINDQDIEELFLIDYDYPTIIVNDYIEFFSLLLNIVNDSLRLLNVYGDRRYPEDHCTYILRRIWLRMGPEDFMNVENFLSNQLSMIKNTMFDDYKFDQMIGEYYGADVYASTYVSATWDETPRHMSFYMIKNRKIHDLPKVHFGFVDDICYIYGIQNRKGRLVDKNIERTLYKINKDKKNLNVHPGSVYSLILFINLLIENDINQVRVPLLQVLSYDYHVYLSEREKINFPIKWNSERLERLNVLNGMKKEFEENQYRRDLEWYNNIVDKEDTISKMKIDYLYDLFIRIQEHFPNLVINNEVGIQGNFIDITLNKEKKLVKKPR